MHQNNAERSNSCCEAKSLPYIHFTLKQKVHWSETRLDLADIVASISGTMMPSRSQEPMQVCACVWVEREKYEGKGRCKKKKKIGGGEDRNIKAL